MAVSGVIARGRVSMVEEIKKEEEGKTAKEKIAF